MRNRYKEANSNPLYLFSSAQKNFARYISFIFDPNKYFPFMSNALIACKGCGRILLRLTIPDIKFPAVARAHDYSSIKNPRLKSAPCVRAIIGDPIDLTVHSSEQNWFAFDAYSSHFPLAQVFVLYCRHVIGFARRIASSQNSRLSSKTF